MANEVTQIKVTLPNPLMDYLASKAGKFGMTLSGYVKNLIINDVKDMDYPVFQASARTEESYRKAMLEKDKAIKITDVGKYFQDL